MPFLLLSLMALVFATLREMKSSIRWGIVAAIVLMGMLFAHKLDPLERTQDSYTNFNKAMMVELLQTHSALFINITADWCLTCKYNEVAVLHTDWFQDFLRQNNIEYIEVDWTRRNDGIGEFLESYGRVGIPFSMIISQDKRNVLPELLTKGIVESSWEAW